MFDKEKLVIMAGMPRGGSTYMYKTLGNHPNICTSSVKKEINYFCYNYQKGLDWYFNLFEDDANTQCYFEVSPFYFIDNDDCLLRIKEFNPNQKIFITLRDPNQYVNSLYYQIKRTDPIIETFDQFVDNYAINHESYKINHNLRHFDYVARVKRFQELFKDNLLLIDFDYFSSHVVETLQEIETFCGVTPFFQNNNVDQSKINSSYYKNSRFLSYLSKQRFVQDVAHRLLPKRLTEYLRDTYIYGKESHKESKREEHHIYPENQFKEHFFQNENIVRC